MSVHLLRRPLRVLAAALFATLVAACGGGGGGSTSPPETAVPGQLRAAQPGELAAYFKERIARRSEKGIEGTLQPVGVLLTGSTAGGAPMQEAGVDEDDLIKSDGDRIFALHVVEDGTARLRTSRIRPDGSLADVAMNDIGDPYSPRGLFLASEAHRLAVISEPRFWVGLADGANTASWMTPASRVQLDLFDISADSPAPAKHIEIDGRIVAARMIGTVLYVASSWSPDLSMYPVPALTPRPQVEELLKDMTSDQLLPTIRIDGAPAQPLTEESQCMLQPDNASLSLQLTTVTAFDLASPTLARASRCMVGDASTLYMSPSSVYLATSRDVWFAGVAIQPLLPREVMTDIHKFSLQGLEIDYRGSGEIAGHLGWDVEKMPYRMSEHNGDLRVLGFTGTEGWQIEVPPAGTASPPRQAPSPATLTILRENPQQRRLVKIASLPNARRPAAIGAENEQVYAVHFAGDRGYVVTFRRTDPLHVLDLSDPSDPKVAGELVVPGYSDYLFPVGEGRLLGVGRSADAQGVAQGLQVSLFDVADASRPALLASTVLGERFGGSALDGSRHGIGILAAGDRVRVALPVVLSQAGSGSLRQGLARFDLDLAAGTIGVRPLVEAPVQSGYIGFERGMVTDKASYYLTGGQLIAVTQP